MEYTVPASLKQAEALCQKAKSCSILAGGTFLNWKRSPSADLILDIKGLGLDRIKMMKNKAVIGAACTIQELSHAKGLPLPVIKAARWVTSRNIRNMATVGGNVTGRFYVSHLLPVLSAYMATTDFYRGGKTVSVPVWEWIKTRPGIICSVTIERLHRHVFLEQEKVCESDAPAIVTAVGLDMSGRRILRPVVAVSGASAPLSLSYRAAKYLEGKGLYQINFIQLTEAVLRDIVFKGNVKTSARVKSRILEDHLRSIIDRIKKER